MKRIFILLCIIVSFLLINKNSNAEIDRNDKTGYEFRLEKYSFERIWISVTNNTDDYLSVNAIVYIEYGNEDNYKYTRVYCDPNQTETFSVRFHTNNKRIKHCKVYWECENEDATYREIDNNQYIDIGYSRYVMVFSATINGSKRNNIALYYVLSILPAVFCIGAYFATLKIVLYNIKNSKYPINPIGTILKGLLFFPILFIGGLIDFFTESYYGDILSTSAYYMYLSIILAFITAAIMEVIYYKKNYQKNA